MTLSQAIQHILSEYGRSVLTDHKLVEALLRDLSPEESQRRDVNLAIIALKEGVPRELISMNAPPEIVIGRLIKRLEDQLYYPENIAMIAIDVWANALSIILPIKPEQYIKLLEIALDGDMSAIKQIFNSAEQGDSNAQFTWAEYMLAVMHLSEEGTEKNSSEAINWFRKAAEQEHPDAQYMLAVMHQSGEGTEKNSSEAINWFRKAADQGDFIVQGMLAVMHYFGKGTEKNYSEAIKWSRKGAEQGHAEAQYMLADMHLSGDGTEKNSSEAIKWFRKAAEQEHPEAQYKLAVMHYLGEGTEKNSSEAIKWFRKAAEQGNAEALNFLAKL